MISFRPLSLSDISQMWLWFNEPHVQQFYSLRTWSDGEVLEKLKPIIEHQKPIYGFIAFVDAQPIGYLQYYKVKDFPWPEQNLTNTIQNQAFGLDLFIGDPRFIGKGIGSEILNHFLNSHIWPQTKYCIVDPDQQNISSIKMFEKCEFTVHQTIQSHDALKRPVKLLLMIKTRPENFHEN